LHFGCTLRFISPFVWVFHGRNTDDLFVSFQLLPGTAFVHILSMPPFWANYVKMKAAAPCSWEMLQTLCLKLSARTAAAAVQESCAAEMQCRNGEREKVSTSFSLTGSLLCASGLLLVVWNPRASAKMYCLMFSAFQRFSKQKGLSWASCCDHDRSKTPLCINLKPLTS